jgi:hypothetical protein
MSLKQLVDAAGAPGEGLHAWRVGSGAGLFAAVGGLAAADVALTAAAAAGLAALAGASANMTGAALAIGIFLLLVVVGAFVHAGLEIDTALNRWVEASLSAGTADTSRR